MSLPHKRSAEDREEQMFFYFWRSEQESNPHWQYRKLQSYPLNDRSIYLLGPALDDRRTKQATLYLPKRIFSTETHDKRRTSSVFTNEVLDESILSIGELPRR